MIPDTEMVVLLDAEGARIGIAPKSSVHGADTRLHLAFSCHVFDPRGRLLVTRRALTKTAWPGVWTNSFCGHPAPGEELIAAVRRRAGHELGIALDGIDPVLPFFRGIVDALAVAFSTASSSATLPVAMRVAEKNLGIARPVFSTVLPLGASIGKDGTAMYVGLLSMFALQAFGTPLTLTVYALVLLTGALAAFGTAPVPSASLFMLAAVLSAVGVTPEQTALVVGFVLPFDRLLDMTRTVPSASANLTVATTVARWEGELDEEVYRSRPEA